MAGIKLKNLSMTYPNGTQALRHVDLEIPDHEFIVLLGPSGCGKTTLLRTVAGLEKPGEGEVLFDGKCVNELEPMKRNVAMVFQTFALYPHLTVFKNMAFPLKSMHLSVDEIQRRVEEAAKILDIEHLLNRRPRVLSGGQRQRVALGRAMVREPVAFLLDEPLSNLDVKMRLELRDQIISLHKRLNTTFIYVTHDQAEAMQLGDRIAVMEEGRIVQIGSPQEVYDHPNSVYVADFVGAPKMNFFASHLRRTDSIWTVRLMGEEIRVPEARFKPDVAISEGMNVILGVRPEEFRIAPNGMANEISFEAQVQRVVPMGASLHVEAMCGSRRFLASVANGTQADPGDTVRFHVNGDRVHIFDGESRINICGPAGKEDEHAALV